MAMDHKLVARSMGGRQQVEKLAATFSKPSQVRAPVSAAAWPPRRRRRACLASAYSVSGIQQRPEANIMAVSILVAALIRPALIRPILPAATTLVDHGGVAAIHGR